MLYGIQTVKTRRVFSQIHVVYVQYTLVGLQVINDSICSLFLQVNVPCTAAETDVISAPDSYQKHVHL